MARKDRPAKKYVYNFPELKKEFFLSEFRDIENFFLNNYGIKHVNQKGSLQRNVLGWAKEKKEWLAQIVERSLDEIQGFEAKENAKALIMIMGALRHKIGTEERAKGLNIDSLHKLWEMFMTMNGRVTRITRQLQPEQEEKPFNFSEDAKNRRAKYIQPGATTDQKLLPQGGATGGSTST